MSAISGAWSSKRDAATDSIGQGGRETTTETKRSRGRPRVETKDESAKEIRRAQLRNAQRSYRSRREDKIFLLERKIDGLQDRLCKANTSVLTLYREAINTELGTFHPKLFQELESIAISLSSSESDFTVRDECGDEDHQDLEAFAQRQRSYVRRKDSSQRKPSQDPTSPTSHPFKRMQLALGYELITESSGSPTTDEAVFTPSTSISASSNRGPVSSKPLPESNIYYDDTIMPFETTFDDSSFRYDTTPPTIDPQLFIAPSIPWEPPISSIPGNPESSFDRYFHRACLELALDIIREYRLDPAKIRNRMLVPLQYMSLEEVEQRTLLRLCKSTNESLDSWYDYPTGCDRDIPKVKIVVHADGTQSLIDGGPLLYPEDLQDYLVANDVRLDPRTQYVECETERMGSSFVSCHDSYEEEDVSSPATCPFPDPVHAMPWLRKDEASSRRRRKVTVDVQKLLKGLVAKAHCAGRAPAVRRGDVDRAFWKAVIPVAAS